MDENQIAKVVVDTAIHLHKELGPGLLESVYEAVLVYRLRERGLEVRRQVPIPIKYANLCFDEGFRADVIVEGKLILELKCVERLHYSHRKQLLTYLRLSGLKLGLLLNFSESLMHHGITRSVNQLVDDQERSSS